MLLALGWDLGGQWRGILKVLVRAFIRVWSNFGGVIFFKKNKKYIQQEGYGGRGEEKRKDRARIDISPTCYDPGLSFAVPYGQPRGGILLVASADSIQ